MSCLREVAAALGVSVGTIHGDGERSELNTTDDDDEVLDAEAGTYVANATDPDDDEVLDGNSVTNVTDPDDDDEVLDAEIVEDDEDGREEYDDDTPSGR